jgi:hypothetical protein
LQSLLCFFPYFSILNFLQVTLQWRTQREKHLKSQNHPRSRLFLLQPTQENQTPLHFQLQVSVQPLLPPCYHGVFRRFFTYRVKELTFVSILIYNNLGFPTTLLFSNFQFSIFFILFPPGYHGVFRRFFTYRVKELTLVSILICNNPGFSIISLFSKFYFSLFSLETPSPNGEEVDIEAMEIQNAVNQASKGLGSSINSTSSQPINHFFAPTAASTDLNPMDFDDLFEETSFNLEQVVVLTHVPKEVDWNAIKNHFSVEYGLLNLEYSALDRNSDTCYLAFLEISVALAAKGYKGPLGAIDSTHSKKFIQAEFMVDLDSNLPYRVVLFNVQPGDTIDALSSKMDAIPIKIKIVEGRNFAIAFFDVISEWCKVLAQQYFVVNHHAISILDAIDSTNQAQFYRLFMGWIPRMAKHAQLIKVVERISGHLPLHLAIVKDNNNLSRGFAFLVVKTLEEKEKMLNANEFTLKSCKCKFKEARPLKRAQKH